MPLPKAGKLKLIWSCKKRVAIVSIAALLLLTAALAAILLFLFYNRVNRVSSSDNLCTTKECYERGAAIIDSIDDSVKACDDFYQYACGGWISKVKLPPDQSVIDPFTILGDRIRKVINASLLNYTVHRENLTYAVDKAAFVLQECVAFDAATPYDTSLKQFKMALDRVDAMPMLSTKWVADDFDTEAFVAKILGVSLDSFFLVDVLPDEKNSSIYRISIYQPTLFIQRSYMLNESSASFVAYREFALAVLTQLCASFAPSAVSQVTADVDEMLLFERQLAAISLDSAEATEYTKLLTLRPISDLEPSLRKILEVFIWKRLKRGIAESENIQFMLGIKYPYGILQLFNSSSKRAIANFGMWSIIRGVLFETLPASIRAHAAPFIMVDQGSVPVPRWKTCLNMADAYYGMAVGRIYIDEHFDRRIKQQVTDMIGYVQGAFLKNSILENDWLDAETKSAAAEKLGALTLAIGYPDYLLDDVALNQLYENYPQHATASFADYVLQCAMAKSNALIDMWSKSLVDRAMWMMSPHQVQAYFDHNRNMVAMLAAVLSSPPFYQQNVPQALNFGAIGWVIGHEISHGYDSNGRAYDKDGNLRDWWKSNDSVRNFERRGNCMAEQYNNLCYPENQTTSSVRCVNGHLTKAENIADFGGIPAAYSAYKEWKAKKGPDMKLPGLTHYTDEQLFFLGAASMWCEHHNPQHLALVLLNDGHSPGRFRVNGVFWAMPEFVQAFQCPIGSEMNPANAQRCKVW